MSLTQQLNYLKKPSTQLGGFFLQSFGEKQNTAPKIENSVF